MLAIENRRKHMHTLPTITKNGEPISWDKVQNFTRYLISTDGRIYNTHSKQMVKARINRDYIRAHLRSDDGEWKGIYVHRLVYQAHVGEIPKGMQINHKDENKLNNNLWNLELTTVKENSNYGTRNEKISKANSKRVYQCDKNGKLIETWESITEARKWGYSVTAISRCCNGHINQYIGFTWSFTMPNQKRQLNVH